MPVARRRISLSPPTFCPANELTLMTGIVVGFISLSLRLGHRLDRYFVKNKPVYTPSLYDSRPNEILRMCVRIVREHTRSSRKRQDFIYAQMPTHAHSETHTQNILLIPNGTILEWQSFLHSVVNVMRSILVRQRTIFFFSYLFNSEENNFKY